MNEPSTSTSMIIPGSTTRTLNPYYDEEISLIHRSFKQKETEWNKTRIKLEQKIEFLEIQLREINEREMNLKNLNNSIMTAFNDFSKDATLATKIPKEIEILNDQHSREIFEIKRRYEKTIKEMEQERDDFKKTVFFAQEEKSRFEKEIKHLNERIADYEQKFMKWDESIYQREKYLKECYDSENGIKLKDLRNEMLKIKEIHAKEKELMEQTSQKNIEALKSSFEQEKKLLLGKMDALKEEIGILNKNNSKSNGIYEELKAKMNQEIIGLRQQKDELLQKYENIVGNTQQIKAALKDNEQLFENKLKISREEKALLQEEIKRLKQTISDNQNKIKKIEHSEKTLRTLLNEKESYMDEEKVELKKKLFNEKKKNEQMMEFANKLKEDFNKKHAIVVQEILNKEEEIRKYKQTISKMTTSARRTDKSQEKSPFRTSCYHQNCVGKSNNTSDHFYDTNSKRVEETKHFCSCQDHSNSNSRLDHSNIQNNLAKTLCACYAENFPKSQNDFFLPQNNNNNMNKSAIIEKNYDLPLKRDNFDQIINKPKQTIETQQPEKNFNSPNNNNISSLTNIMNEHEKAPVIISRDKNKKALTLRPQQQKDYSKKLSSLLNKENEAQNPQEKRKKPSIIDPNKSLLLECNHDLSVIKSKEISTTKSKQPSKSPKINKKPELFKRNRSISKHEKISTPKNNFAKPKDKKEKMENIENIEKIEKIGNIEKREKIEQEEYRDNTINNNNFNNNNFEIINTSSSIECTICKKIINIVDFMEHLNQCSGITPENTCYSNNPQTVLSDLSNIHHNMSFNTSSENPEAEKKPKYNGTIHDSIPNGLFLNRKHDENFFSLAPGIAFEGDFGNFIKNESQRYVDSPSNNNMTNEFSTSHKKGLIQESLINSSFVIKSMNEIKRNSKK